MDRPALTTRLAFAKRAFSFAALCRLSPAMLLLLGCLLAAGCGDSKASKQQTAVAQEDPQGEFEWGVTRLKRALRLFRPSSVDGLNIIEQKVDPKFFAPSDANSQYSAQITITTKTAFLHGKRPTKKSNKKDDPSDDSSGIDDPLAEQFEDEGKLLDLPGIGPQAPVTISPRVETRSLENETVFDMVYVDGYWKLTKQPELKHEQLWFEYAFE